jgi:hypothetical protein
MPKKEEIRMIKKVSILINQSLICGGLAIVEQDGHEDCIDFDIVKGGLPPQVIVGGRGKKISDENADIFEEELLEVFVKHNISYKLGEYDVSACG